MIVLHVLSDVIEVFSVVHNELAVNYPRLSSVGLEYLPQTTLSCLQGSSAVGSFIQLSTGLLELIPVAYECLHLIRSCNAQILLSEVSSVNEAAGSSLEGVSLEYARIAGAIGQCVTKCVREISLCQTNCLIRSCQGIIVDVISNPVSVVDHQVSVVSAQQVLLTSL